MKRTGLTRRQIELLDLLTNAEETPSYDEMVVALGLRSKCGVHRLVCALEERGYITRRPHRARSIEVTNKPVEQHIPSRPLPVHLNAVRTLDLMNELMARGYAIIPREPINNARSQIADRDSLSPPFHAEVSDR